MTTEQINIISADLFAKRDQVLIGNKTVAQYLAESNYQRLMNYLNKKNDTSSKIWRPDVNRDEVVNAVNFTEFIALSAAKRDAAAVFLSCTIFDLTVARVRDNITEIFGAASDSTTKIFAKCDRIATNLELLFTTTSVSSLYGYQVNEGDMKEIFSALKQLIKAL